MFTFPRFVRHQLCGPLGRAARDACAILLVACALVFSTAATAQQAAPQLPKDVDPCGGPSEIINKLGPTPCNAVPGQTIISTTYTNTSATGRINLPRFAPTIGGHIVEYPTPVVLIGVSPTIQFEFTPPSVGTITSGRVGQITGNTDTTYGFQKRLPINMNSHMLTAYGASVTFPTGTPPFQGNSPSYQAWAALLQPLPLHLSLSAEARVQYKSGTNSSGKAQRFWAFLPTLVFGYVSRGGTGLFVQAEFPSLIAPQTGGSPITIAAVEQQLGAHIMLEAYYGLTGQGRSIALTPAAPSLPVSVNARALGLSVNFLLGRPSPALP